MRKYKTKICIRCGKKFIPTGSRQKCCCDECESAMRQKYIREYMKVYRLMFPDKIKELKKKDYLKHFVRWNEYSKQYKLTHPGYNKQWNKTHPEKVKEMNRRHFNKRRNLGFIPLNEPKEGYVFHHLDETYGIYMLEKDHKSISHCLETGKGMDTINAVAFNYLEEKSYG